MAFDVNPMWRWDGRTVWATLSTVGVCMNECENKKKDFVRPCFSVGHDISFFALCPL